MKEEEKVRIDKYLWAIRIFKTRSWATEACKAGRIKLLGQNLKASYFVKIGDIYQVSKSGERKVIKVLAIQQNRTDAATAATKYEDLTPLEERSNFRSVFHAPVLKRDRGAGRPTKKDRREIDDLFSDGSAD